MKKKTEKIGFKRGINRINFPILYPGDFRDEIAKINKLKLPKYSVIGFEARYHKDFDMFEVFIEK